MMKPATISLWRCASALVLFVGLLSAATGAVGAPVIFNVGVCNGDSLCMNCMEQSALRVPSEQLQGFFTACIK